MLSNVSFRSLFSINTLNSFLCIFIISTAVIPHFTEIAREKGGLDVGVWGLDADFAENSKMIL